MPCADCRLGLVGRSEGEMSWVLFSFSFSLSFPLSCDNNNSNNDIILPVLPDGPLLLVVIVGRSLYLIRQLPEPGHLLHRFIPPGTTRIGQFHPVPISFLLVIFILFLSVIYSYHWTRKGYWKRFGFSFGGYSRTLVSRKMDGKRMVGKRTG